MADVAVADRTLPHNLEAERSVLGAILLHNEMFNLAAEVIDAQDFFRDAHRRIFDKMVALVERGGAIDLVTLKEELGRSGDLDEVGGPAYIAALVDGVPRSTNVEHYARIIKEKSTLRRLIYSANKIVASAYEAEDNADVILDEAEHAIFAIADDKVRDGFVSLRDLAQASLDTIEKLHARKELITGVPTGFTDLDELTSGLQPSDLIIVAARPSMGKTSLVLNIAQHVGTKTDLSVGIFSLEMSKEQLFLRMLTAEARIDAHRLRGGFLGERDWGRLSQAIGTLSEAKIFIDDTPSIGVLEMRAKCRRLASEHGLHLVIVDYIQLMEGRGRFENRTLELGSISRSVKALAKELNVPIIVLSQLSRAPESRSDHRPQLSDLRECVTGDTLVVLTDGRRLPIRDVVGTKPVVWAYSSGALSPAQADKVWMVGRRPVSAVRLASGRVIRATAEHRVLSDRGWTEIAGIEIGDRVALARSVPEPPDAQPWPELRVALLGHLIGDGSYLTNQPLRYTTASSENSKIVTEAARQEFGCTVTRYEGPTGTWHQLLITGNGDRWHPAGVIAWLKELGVFGQRSYQKRIPAAAFRLPNTQIALLLRHLWATDGCIALRRGRGAPSVYYATNSEGLALDVAALLLRLGIVARITVARKAGYRPGFHVRVSGTVSQRTFLNLVGAHGPRTGPARALAIALDGVVTNPNVGTLPRAIFERVRERMGTAVLEYAALLDAEDLRAAATDVLFWDRVVSIEPAGEEQVYDLTVPGPSNWLADGIVTHNSGALEQDSDVVVFIYREDQYTDRSAPAADSQGVAELIIGKQRNGPTGVVKLAFIREFTRFENLALGKA